MLKAAIEKISELAKPTTLEVDGKTYANASFFEVEPKLHYPACIELNSLEALATMVKTEAVVKYPGEKLYITIPTYGRAECFMQPDNDRFHRNTLYLAKMTDVPGFRDGWWDHETAIIKLRSQFQPNDGTDYILDLLSRISTEDSAEQKDNGVSQSVTVRKGVALAGTEQVKPIVKLRPYRTFQELMQPESDFLLRVRDGNEIGLFEADGGMWKLDARQSIKYHLEMLLKDLIDDGIVVVML